VWYKVDSSPVGPSDGTRSVQRTVKVEATKEGEQPVFVWVEDNLGRKSFRHTTQAVLKYDGTAPAAEVKLAGTERVVPGLEVELDIQTTDVGGSGATEVALSNDKEHWKPFTLPRNRTSWDLDERGGWGPRTVYWRAQDGAGNRSEVQSLTITYAPSAENIRKHALERVAADAFEEAWREIADGRKVHADADVLKLPLPAAHVTVNNADPITNSLEVNLSVAGWDRGNSEVTGVEVSNSGSDWTTLSLPLEQEKWRIDQGTGWGERPIRWRLKNAAGLVSEEQAISVTYADPPEAIRARALQEAEKGAFQEAWRLIREARKFYPDADAARRPLPAAKVTLNDGQLANSLEVPVAVTGWDVGNEEIAGIEFSNDAAQWTQIRLPAQQATWPLAGQGWGERTVHWRLKNHAGLTSEEQAIGITYAEAVDAIRALALQEIAKDAFQEAWRLIREARKFYPNADAARRPLPAAKVTLNNGQLANSLEVPVTVTGWDVGNEEIAGIEFSNDAAQWTQIRLPAQQATWPLAGQGWGERTVHWRLKNHAGLTSEEQSARVTYAETVDVVLSRAGGDIKRGAIDDAKKLLVEAQRYYPKVSAIEAPLRELDSGLLILFQYQTPPEEASPIKPLNDFRSVSLSHRDNYRFAFIPSRECYVYAFQEDSRHSIPIFPNAAFAPQTNPLPAGRVQWLPEKTSEPKALWLHLDASVGQERVYFVAVTKPLRDVDAFARQLLESREKLGDALRRELQAFLQTDGPPGASCFADNVMETFAFNHENALAKGEKK
jgi:hypothetical protein